MKQIMPVILISLLTLFGCKNKPFQGIETPPKERKSLSMFSEEEQAAMRAEFARWSEAYTLNPMKRDYLITYFSLKYEFREQGQAYRDILNEEAGKNNSFALASYGFRAGLGSGLLPQLQKQAAELGEPNAMLRYGYELLYKKGNPEGLTYIENASVAGEAAATGLLVEYYHKENDIENMCRTAKIAYEGYSLELLVDSGTGVLYDIYRNCGLFGDKDYSKSDMLMRWLDDLGTEEAMYAKARELSTLEPVLAKRLFEELAISEDNKISANSLGCLGYMYYKRYESDRNLDDLVLAREYADKAFAKGNMCGHVLITGDKSIPPVPYITDFRGNCGCF